MGVELAKLSQLKRNLNRFRGNVGGLGVCVEVMDQEKSGQREAVVGPRPGMGSFEGSVRFDSKG